MQHSDGLAGAQGGALKPLLQEDTQWGQRMDEAVHGLPRVQGSQGVDPWTNGPQWAIRR